MADANITNVPQVVPPGEPIEILPPTAGYISEAESRAIDFLNPKVWQQIRTMAEVFVMSKALPKGIDNAPQAIMIMQAGYEMGLKPVEALQSICIINGKLSLYGETAIAKVVQAGHNVEFLNCTDKTATCRITRGDDKTRFMENTFTMEMAKARGFTRNSSYSSGPENMLKFKAFHMTAKFIVPDAFHNLPIAEVLEAEAVETRQSIAPPKDILPPKVNVVPVHRPLSEALKEPEPVEPSASEVEPEKPKRAKKVKKEEPEENGYPVTEDTMQAHYKELVEAELTRPLTEEEKTFIVKYEMQPRP